MNSGNGYLYTPSVCTHIMQGGQNVTTYRLDIPDDLWNEYKSSLSKGETLNEAIQELIEQEVQSDG